MPFVGGSPPSSGGARPSYTSSVLLNESGSVVGTVTSGASANTFGSWVNIGTTTFAVDSFFLQIAFTALRGVLVDISYGASGGANVVASGIAFSITTNTMQGVTLPVRIPNGVNVWARTSATAGSTAIQVGLTLSGPQTSFSFTSCEAVTTGTNVNTVGAVCNVDNVGTWVAIGSPTSTAYAGFLIFCGGNNDTARTAGDIIARLGTGSAGSQVDVFETFIRSPTGTLVGPSTGPYYASFPSSTQFWARADASTATGDTANITIMGLVA